jgi:hypothetical protein
LLGILCAAMGLVPCLVCMVEVVEPLWHWYFGPFQVLVQFQPAHCP